MENQIGPRIKHLRREKGLTLEVLAKRTGITKGYLSKIERGIQTPPISTLSRIAVALGIDMADFFTADRQRSRCTIVRQSEREPVRRSGRAFGYHYEAIAHSHPNKTMDPFVITLVPHATDHTVFSHPGEEMMLVLEGAMMFLFGEERHELREGDCVYFDSSVPHRGECLGDKEAKVLAVISYRKTLD
jgi:transcriptional regulator with XRE-family HTH domain